MGTYLTPISAIWMARIQDPFFWILTIVNIFICIVVLRGAYQIWRERYPKKEMKGGYKKWEKF